MIDSELRASHKKEFFKSAARVLAVAALTATLAATVAPKPAQARWLLYPDGVSPEDTYSVTTEYSPPHASRLIIPAINVDAPIEDVGVTEDGAMDTPHQDEKNDVGLYAPGPEPGENGRAVIDGHKDTETDVAVFENLGKLKPGDLVVVQRTDGSVLNFSVTRFQSYSDKDFPLNQVFGDSDKADLNLITCDGDFDRKSQDYNQRLVVYTHLVTNS